MVKYLFIFLSLFLTGCATIQPLLGLKSPELNVKNAKISDFNAEDLTIDFDVEVYNPNLFGATLPSLSYKLFIEDDLVLRGARDQTFKIDRKETSQIKIPVTLNYAALNNVMAKLSNKDWFEYKLLIDMDFDFPVFGGYDVPVKYTNKLPVLRMPNFSISRCKMSAMTLNGAEIDLEIMVDNPNAFDFKVDNLFYDFKVDGKTWAQGVSVKKLELLKKSKSKLQIPIVVNFVTMGKTILEVFSEGKIIDYELKGKCDLESDLVNDGKSIMVPFGRNGQIKLDKKQ